MTGRFAGLIRRGTQASLGGALGVLLLTTPATAQTPGSGQPRVGGSLRLIYWAQPQTLNPFFVNDPRSTFAELALDGLARVGPDGSFVPLLAAEIPTQANGDVSADGTVVTWKLRPGVTWSDGQPFTSQDVLFTYEMLIDPANPVLDRSDYAAMDSVVAPDSNTVVVTYKHLYAPYRLAFPFVFPAHVFSGQTNIAQDPFNQGPTVGTGPFVFKSGSMGDAITFARNPDYREPGKPYLDEVAVRFTPARNNGVPALAAGDVDAALSLSSADLPRLATMQDARVNPAPALTGNALFLNASCSSGPQQGDPDCPNSVLGDLRVRQAIELAIDKQGLFDGVVSDVGMMMSSLLPTGPYEVDLPPSEFNPSRARQVLDQAGWLVGSDGVRTRQGVRAHLAFFISSGGAASAAAAQIIQNNLQDVGIETEIKESPVMQAGFVGGSPYNLGSFDLAFGTVFTTLDPQAYLYSHYASDQVPNPQLQSGNNYSRIQDPQLDQLLMAAGSTLDDAQRQANYRAASELIKADVGVIPLFSSIQVDARESYVEGWGPTNVNDDGGGVTWNIQDWWLNK
jgi:peptide/nickel transport system substrate-binding protein